MSLVSNSVAALVVAGISMAGIDLITETIEAQPVSLSLDYLRYEDGNFTQKHIVTGGPVIGTWAAQIKRGGTLLCSDGGIAPYNNDPKTMPAQMWAGAECPEALQAGDTASATWEWANGDGTRLKISGEITIAEDG